MQWLLWPTITTSVAMRALDGVADSASDPQTTGVAALPVDGDAAAK